MAETVARSGVATAIIVGGGIAGLTLAWNLTRRGVAVTVFEQGPLPNPRASSYDEHRITRHAYGFQEGYAWLMPQAFRTWEALWRDLGTSHYEETDGLYVLRQEDGWYESTTASLDALGIAHRDVPLAEVASRLPMLRPDGISRTLEVKGSGMLFNIRIMTDLVVHLSRLGTRFHTGAAVTQVHPDRGEIVAGGRTHAADVVVVTAGAWFDRLLPDLRRKLVPSRQAVLYLAPPPDYAEAWARAPVLGVRDEDGVYVLPPRRGTRLKVGDHAFSRVGDAEDDRLATEADLARLWRAMRTIFRDVDRYAVLERKACYYTVTDDERFHVAPLGPRGWVVSACSGHGFKLSALITDGLARGIVGEADPQAVPDWAAGRTADGVLA
jgi:sarcosine oxidase/sarcosine oxidase subunit beta